MAWIWLVSVKLCVMRFLITILVFSTNALMLCQTGSTEKLSLEWRKEMTDGITGIIPASHTLLIATMAGVSQLNADGAEINFSKSSSGIYTLEENNGKIYTVGYMNLEERSREGIKMKDVVLYQAENTPLSARNGMVYNNYLYTTNIDRYFFKYDLSGNKMFDKEIGELCENKLLQIGDGNIYVYSLLNKPALGGRLMQYDTLGNQKWSISPGLVNNILADKDGNCYVFVLVAQKSNIVNKYSPSGTLIWSKEVPNQTVNNGFVFGDSLFTCGIQTIESAAGGEQNPVYSILSTKDGKVIHQQMFDFYQGDEGYGECFTQVAYDGQALYLGGSSGSLGYVRSFLIKLSVNGATGLKKEKGSTSSFNVFPNPGGSKFTITCENSQASTTNITVRNISGQVVYKKEISCNADKSFTLDLGKQGAGNYTVEIVSGQEKAVKKIVVE
jgi:hypothetical protein